MLQVGLGKALRTCEANREAGRRPWPGSLLRASLAIARAALGKQSVGVQASYRHAGMLEHSAGLGCRWDLRQVGLQRAARFWSQPLARRGNYAAPTITVKVASATHESPFSRVREKDRE